MYFFFIKVKKHWNLVNFIAYQSLANQMSLIGLEPWELVWQVLILPLWPLICQNMLALTLSQKKAFGQDLSRRNLWKIKPGKTIYHFMTWNFAIQIEYSLMYPYLGSLIATFIVQAISRIFSIFALIFTCISARVIKSAICFLFYTIFPTLKSTMLVIYELVQGS